MVSGRKVIIPIDGSENSERAFAWYVEELMKPGDNVTCLHVVEPMSLPLLTMDPLPQPPFPEWEDKIRGKLAAIEQLKTKYENQMKSLDICGKMVIEEASLASVGGQICEIISREGGSLVVVGNRGLGAVRRTVLGSKSDYVLHHARVPVVIVPPKM